MTDIDKNVRTLIVCFVLALAVLVPLRLSYGTVSVVTLRQAEVLGETETNETGDRVELIYKDEVVLPNAEVPIVVETEE